jgi:glycosyltransferase involved in cell wall biosynthesis
MSTPAVSVILPAYNCATYIEEAMRSILDQTMRDFELLVIDDGSTDNTLAVVQRVAAEDGRVRIISRPNTGLSKALNEAITAAKAPLVARMDADDVSLPRRLERQLEYMRAHPECVLLGTSVMLIDPYGLDIAEMHNPLEHDEIEAQLMTGRGGTVVHPTAMMRRDALIAVGLYRSEFDRSEDLDLFLRLAEHGRVANIGEALLRYRRHLASVSHMHYRRQWEIKRAIIADAYKRRGLEMPSDWDFKPWQPPPAPTQLREWGWAAIKAGRPDAARKHALNLLKHSPLSGDSWRLMYCALRGR